MPLSLQDAADFTTFSDMKMRLALTLMVVLSLTSIIGAVAPGAPQALLVSVSGNTVTLTWTAPSTGGVPTGYFVVASLSPSGAPIASLPVSDTQLVVTGVPNGVYYVHVRAVNIDGTSGPSNEVIAVVPSGPGGCTSPPNAPTNFSANVQGNLVTLAWASPVGGCAATAYAVQAGSAPGLSDLAILNVGAATTLSVSAPTGTYYVRIVALNAFGGSVPSLEIIVNVGTVQGNRIVVTFDGLAGVENRSPVTTYTEDDFTVTTTAQDWVALTTFGNPAPFIQFLRLAGQSTLVGELTVRSGGDLFSFESVDMYSSVTPIPHEIIGLRAGAPVFTFSGTVPNTLGRFDTVVNVRSTVLIDTLVIRVTNPATFCCNNPVGIDNIVVAR